MSEQEYLELMYVFRYNMGEDMLITFPNGLKAKCNAFHGMAESDTEPGDDDYIGEYYTFVKDVEIIEKGRDDSVEIYNDSIEISLKCIPSRIELEDGTLLWQSANA